MGVTSILAPEFEKGASVFWVQVDPLMPPLYVTAGSSALEISEKWCRRYNHGPSQIPLVAWKILEAYPRYMEAARKSGTLLPATITLDYAVRQREVQAAILLVAIWWMLLWRRSFRSGKKCSPSSSSGVFTGCCRPLSSATTPLSHRRDKGGRYSRLLRRLRAVGKLSSVGNASSFYGKLCRLRRAVGNAPSVGIASSLCGTFCRLRSAIGKMSSVDNASSSSSFYGSLFSVAAAVEPPLVSVAASSNDDRQDKKRSQGPACGHNRHNSKPTTTTSAEGRSTEEDNSSSVRPPRAISSAVVAGGAANGAASVVVQSSSCSSSERRFDAAGAVTGRTERQEPERPRNGQEQHNGANSGISSRADDSDGTEATETLGRRKERSEPEMARNGQEQHNGANSSIRSRADDRDGTEATEALGVARGGNTGRAVGVAVAAAEDACGREREREGDDAVDQQQQKKRTWNSRLEDLARDPGNRFSETAVLSNAGQILGKTDAFAIETHEACDWVRLVKNKKTDISLGGAKYAVVSRDDGTVVVWSKALATKIIASKTKPGTLVLGRYTELSKLEAKECITWLAGALATAPVR